MVAHPPASSRSAGEAAAARASLVLLEFGFSEPSIERIDRLPEGIKNLNFRVRASGRDWVLKCHPGAGAAERLAFSHRFEEALGEAGFPVAHLERSASGSTIVRSEAGPFTLHSWVSGQQISIDRREAVIAQHPGLPGALGSMLGALHRLGDKLVDETGTEVDFGALLAGPHGTVRSIRHGRPHRFLKTLRLRLRPSRSELDRWILDSLPILFRDARLLASTSVSAMVDPTDVVLAHNDLNWENLIFDPDFDLLAVLDFDNAALLPRALDVGAAAAVLVGPDEVALGRFLDSYSQASGRQVECDAVNVGMHWKCLRSILWSIDSYLSGRVTNTALIEVWCRSLHECLRALPPIDPSR